MKQRTIKQWIKLLEQEELPIKQLLLHFKQFSFIHSTITDDKELLDKYLVEIKQNLNKPLTQTELFI